MALTTTTVPKDASQAKASRLNAVVGRPLPADWVPDDPLCEKVLADFGMGVEDISAELPAFRALNVQNGTLSQDWHATFYLFAKRWKERAARAAPARVELSRPVSSAHFKPTEADWEGAVKLYAKTGRWSTQFGPGPMSRACRCPVEVLRKHGIDPATGERPKPIVPFVEAGNPR